jgi:hypothetical protein
MPEGPLHGTRGERRATLQNTAATVIGDVAGVSRPVTSDRFAAFGGTRPVEVSPGDCKTSGRRRASTEPPRTTLRTWPRSPRSATGTAKAGQPRSSAQCRRRAKPRSSGFSRSAIARPNGRTPWPAGPGESSIAGQRTAHEHATLRNRRPSQRSARTERRLSRVLLGVSPLYLAVPRGAGGATLSGVVSPP